MNRKKSETDLHAESDVAVSRATAAIANSRRLIIEADSALDISYEWTGTRTRLITPAP